ncbi:uncharacterized protein LOC143028238 [Oratosquilla oratoria]|uniref:uncharacterized protein LOC143028238 n=1 Tax=Oratosquilla oratoria TaxID=337810 RepID=UPI003F7674D1
MSSDHLPIKITVHLTPIVHLPPPQGKFELERADWTAYQTFLVDTNFCPDLTSSVEELNTLLTQTVLEAARHAIPVTSAGRGRRGHPWWNDDCKIAVERKKRAYQRYMTDDSEEAYIAMKETKAQCKKAIARAKLAYWSNSKDDHQDLTAAWKRFKELKSRYNPPDGDLTTPDGRVLCTPEERAEGFLHQFASASSTASLPKAQRRFREGQDAQADLSPPTGRKTDLTFFELRWALRATRATRKSPDNKCWREGVVPKAWKHAIVVPIPKAGKRRNQIANYRPVSLTSHIGKIYERIVLSRLQHHVETRGELPKLQAGFRKRRSIIDHVVRLSEHVRRAQKQRRVLLTCFLDIAKAFDTVWHTKLLCKLKAIGVSPEVYNFTRTFLSDRSIAVRWRGTLSSQAKIDMGVPQGSVVAPLLFTLLLADVGKGVRSDTIITAYADDIAMWRKLSPKRTLPNTEQNFGSSRGKWTWLSHLVDLGFTLSAAKTVYMPIHSIGYNRGDYPDWNQLTVCGTPVKPATSVRYLGVIFQRDGRWTRHIQQVCLNARRALNLVRVIRREPWGQRRETLIPIVRSLVRSRLLFGSPALHGLSPESTYKMVQKECQALRLGLDLPHSVPHEQVYNEAGVLPLRYRLKKDAGRYLFGSARVPNSTEDEMYEEWISAPPTAPIHGLPSSVRDLCLRAGLQPSDRRRVAQYQVDPFPPWTISPAEVELDIPGLGRHDNPHLLAAPTRELLALKYQEEFLVYTDGSVLEDGRTGAGIFLEATRGSFSVKLTPTTILTAELVAIKEALNKIIAFPDPPSRVTVLSDSRSSLVVIQRGHCPSSPEILNDILQLSDEAAKMGVRFRYQWVPSHVGLHGNEMADKAAKHGALAPKDSETSIHLTASDAIRRIDRAAWAQWETDYAATASARGWPTSYLGPNPPTLASLPSHISSTISRIRVDHWRTQYTGTYCACGTELS